MSDVCEDEKKEILQKCNYFLYEWENFKLKDVEIVRITSGVANKTYRVILKNAKCLNEIEHQDVIVRIYNSGVFNIKFNGEATEAIVFHMLSKKGLAAKLLGVFRGGRIEQFIPSRPATVNDLNSLEFSKAVMRKIAFYHTLSMPVSKKPKFLDHVIRMVENTKVTDDVLQTDDNECLKLVTNFPKVEELRWLNSVLSSVCHRIVFAHNDMHPNNILVRECGNSIDDKIMLVDYELSMYFYRGYDLLMFLKMKRMKMEMIDNKVSVSFGEEDPSEDDELLQEYLNETRKLNESRFDRKIDNLKTLKMELDFLYLFLAVWGICLTFNMIYEGTVTLPMDWARESVTTYEEKKKQVIDKYGDPVKWN